MTPMDDVEAFRLQQAIEAIMAAKTKPIAEAKAVIKALCKQGWTPPSEGKM